MKLLLDANVIARMLYRQYLKHATRLSDRDQASKLYQFHLDSGHGGASRFTSPRDLLDALDSVSAKRPAILALAALEAFHVVDRRERKDRRLREVFVDLLRDFEELPLDLRHLLHQHRPAVLDLGLVDAAMIYLAPQHARIIVTEDHRLRSHAFERAEALNLEEAFARMRRRP